MIRHIVDNDLLARCERVHTAVTFLWGGMLAVGVGALLYISLALRVPG